METIDAQKAITSQAEYLKEYAKRHPEDRMSKEFSKGKGFAPSSGICYSCHRQIYSNAMIRMRDCRYGQIKEVESKGISVEKASTQLTIGCPHCHHSFVD